MTRYEAWKVAKRFIKTYEAPLTCLHLWTRQYGLILRWRKCRLCGMVEGRLG